MKSEDVPVTANWVLKLAEPGEDIPDGVVYWGNKGDLTEEERNRAIELEPHAKARVA